MRQVVLDAREARPSKRSARRQPSPAASAPGRARAAVAQALEHQAEAGRCYRRHRRASALVGAAVLIDRDVVDVVESNAGLAQAIGDRLRGKPGPMLDPPEPLLLRRGDQHAVAHEAGGGVGVEGVEAEDDHYERRLLRDL